jgi:hypothetical protein
LTLEELADAKGLPPEMLRKAGLKEGVSGSERTPCVDIPYLDERGELLAVRKRLSLDGTLRFIWRRGDKVHPYGLSRLDFARATGSLLIVEGETDTLTLWHTGFATLGLPGAATWKEAWRHHLRGIERVYVWHEPDKGGDSLVPAIARDLPDVLVIEAPLGTKDPNALWLSLGCDGTAFQTRIKELMDSARPASTLQSEALSVEARELLKLAEPLLQDPNLLDRVREAITKSGYAGDTTPPMLVYVSLSSRHLERPLNLAIIAPSASGKNKAVDSALALVPEEAYYVEKAGSARALIYAAEDFAHRVVVVSEADSIPEDGPAASAIRSLAADSYMAYDVVEKDHETGQFGTRHVVKQGPTGLITTYTRPLPEQMNTRMLTCSVADSQDLTRAVLLAHAASVNGEGAAFDASGFKAAQRWLAIAGDHAVVIPFGEALAQLVPTLHIRMRRDFRQALTVIQTIALLYQRQRPRDLQGRVVASLDDYAMARELLLDVFTAAASGGVTAQVRETVLALQGLHSKSGAPVTVKVLGERLGLSKNTAWHRVARAVELGFIANEETRKYQPAKLVPADPLPEERPALPTVEELESFMCVSLAGTGSTFQPGDALQTRGESEPAVEIAVESDVQPEIQPRLEVLPDSSIGREDPAVERLNAIDDEARTATPTDQADSVYARALAEACAHPRLAISEVETVHQGEAAWAKFLALATPSRLRAAINALEARAQQESA